MHLSRQLLQRQRVTEPVRVVVIGAGKFGCMYLAQARQTPGTQVLAVVEVDVQRCRENLSRIGWPADSMTARDLADAAARGTTWISEDAAAAITADAVDVVVDATGNVECAVEHALLAIEHRKHVVMVSVEADAVVGPELARRAEEAGVVYSLAYGDQPALICELVDWARACGFEVTCAGKGTKYLPEYHSSTPDTVWEHYGFTKEQLEQGDFNARMFNSFLDGTKSAIEMAVLANAASLSPQEQGLSFPPCAAPHAAQGLRAAC